MPEIGRDRHGKFSIRCTGGIWHLFLGVEHIHARRWTDYESGRRLGDVMHQHVLMFCGWPCTQSARVVFVSRFVVVVVAVVVVIPP